MTTRSVVVANAVLALAGLAMAVSMYFRHFYGPWGVSISLFDSARSGIRNGVWSHAIFILWPATYGWLEFLLALAGIVGSGSRGDRLRILIVAGFMSFVSVWHLWFAWRYRAAPNDVRMGFTLNVIVLFAVLGVLGLPPLRMLRLQLLRLVAATWILIGLYPVSEWIPWDTILEAYGPGYGLLLAGTLLIAITSIIQLFAALRPRDQFEIQGRTSKVQSV